MVFSFFLKTKLTTAGQTSDVFANNDGIVANRGETGVLLIKTINSIIIAYGIQLNKIVT